MDPSDAIRKFFEGGIHGMANVVRELFANAFSSTDFSATWWVSVMGGTVTTHAGSATANVHHPGLLNQLVLAMLPIVVIMVVLQVGLGVLRWSSRAIARGVFGAILAVPATYLTAGIIYAFMGIRDNLTYYMLETTGGDTAGASATDSIMSLFGMTWDPGSKKVLLDENYQQWQMMKDQDNPGAIIYPLIVMLIVWVLAFVLMCMLTMINVALMFGAAIAPIAIMTQPFEGAKGLAKGWGLMMVGLLVAKPLSAMILTFGLVLGGSSSDVVQLVSGIVVIGFACVSLPACVRFVMGSGLGGAEGLIGFTSSAGTSGRRRAERFVSGAGRRAGNVGRRVAGR